MTNEIQNQPAYIEALSIASLGHHLDHHSEEPIENRDTDFLVEEARYIKSYELESLRGANSELDSRERLTAADSDVPALNSFIEKWG